MWARWHEIWSYRDMLRSLVAKELRARYKGSVLGFVWTFANPLMMLIVYSTVFSFLMRSNIPKFPMFIFVALLPWSYLTTAVLQGAGSLVYNAGLLKKVYFPREVLPVAVVMASMINYLLSLLILVPALILFDIKPTLALLAFPVVLLTETMLAVALAFLVSIGTVYFRDLEHIVGVLVNVWFFLTPVFYPADLIPVGARRLFQLNPAWHIIQAYREIFFFGRWPEWSNLMGVGFICLVLLLASHYLFHRWQRYAAELV